MAERRASPADRLLARWKPIALGLLAVVVANVLAHVLVIRRPGAMSGDRDLILGAARSRVAAVREETETLERTAAKLACARSEISRVFDDLLSSKEERMTAIQREVRELAASRGLDPDRVTYTVNEVKGTGLVRFAITFPLEGRYETLEDFVKAAEDSPNFLIVDSVSITDAAGGNLVLSVELATYFQAPDAEGLARALARAART